MSGAGAGVLQRNNVRKYELWSGLERADRNAFLNLCPPYIVMLQYWAFVKDEKEPLCKYDFQLIPLYHFLNEIP